MSRVAIFDAVKADMPRRMMQDDVAALDKLLDALGVPRAGSTTQRVMQDKGAFYAGVRRVTGNLNQTQVDTIEALLIAAAHWPVSWLAYALATAWHEARLEPIPEWGKGKGRPYAKAGARMKAMPNPPQYGGQLPYGRGLVQLTWNDNYEWADKELGLGGSLLANFERALEPDIAVRILVRGMETGAFTGKGMSRYLKADREGVASFTEARRIINGMDKSAKIAGYAIEFQDAVSAGKWS